MISIIFHKKKEPLFKQNLHISVQISIKIDKICILHSSKLYSIKPIIQKMNIIDLNQCMINKSKCKIESIINENFECCTCKNLMKNRFTLIPCGHTQTCIDCIPKVISENKKCPLCMTKIESYMQIYL